MLIDYLYNFFGKKCLFESFAHFLLLVLLLLSCKSYLYVLDIRPYLMYDLQVFSFVQWVVFFTFLVVFEAQKS